MQNRLARVRRMLLACCLAHAVSWIAANASADVIYDNVPFPSLFERTAGVAESPARNTDNFILSPGATTIDAIHFWGVYQTNITPVADNFSILIHHNQEVPGIIPNEPSTVLAADLEVLSLVRESTPFSMSAPEPITGPAIYKFTVEITPITLAANTPYWLSITNATGRLWAWLGAEGTGPGYDAQYSDGKEWFTVQSDPQGNGVAAVFYLTGPVVPEPSSYLLGALALLGLVALRRSPVKKEKD